MANPNPRKEAYDFLNQESKNLKLEDGWRINEIPPNENDDQYTLQLININEEVVAEETYRIPCASADYC